MCAIQELAADLGVEAETLRRAVSQGTLRVSGNSSRDMQVTPGEREYLCAHWPLLSELRETLLPEHEVRLAVSTARWREAMRTRARTSTCWSPSPTTGPRQDSSLPAAWSAPAAAGWTSRTWRA